ncbi:MAG: DUF4105 domain-containing protein [Candidatus Riflebacteria bacterium]|nr:DUF4105 domain-containing protein [Candidatus Riflebacteria bacterium]
MRISYKNLLFSAFIFFGITVLSCCTLEAGSSPSQQSQIVSSDQGIAIPPYLVSDENGLIKLGNIRWGLKTKNPKQVPSDFYEYSWTNAVINPDMVDEIYYVQRPFKPELIACHVFVVFTFKSGGFVGKTGFRPEGLVISFEAMRQPGDTFNMWKGGMTGKYGVGCVMAAWEDYVSIDCDLLGNRYIPYRMNLEHHQKVDLLRATIYKGLQDFSKQRYQVLLNSCESNLIPEIDSVLPVEKQIPAHLIGKLDNPIANQPKLVPLIFVKNGVFEKRNLVINSSNYFAPLNKLWNSSNCDFKGTIEQ